MKLKILISGGMGAAGVIGSWNIVKKICGDGEEFKTLSNHRLNHEIMAEIY